jgi:hypothetical protein
MLWAGRWRRLQERMLHVRDHRALCRPRLVEGLMYKAVQEEEHNYHPSRYEPQEVLPPK